jgi:probable rRNA maturation factor
MAKERAGEFCWTPREELLLYVVHGILHLVGFDDITPEDRTDMRQKEKEYLAAIGITVPELEYSDDWDDSLPEEDPDEEE